MAAAPAAPLGVVLLIGGGGKLGRALVLRLVAEQAARVIRVLDTAPLSGDVAKHATGIVGDVTDPAAVRAACAGVDTVFHLASLILVFPVITDSLRKVNVEGTRNVIAACRACGVRRLIYTSSLDAVHPGRGFSGYWEKLRYAHSKTLAEQLVLAAHGPDLLTLALRPVHMYGPEDVLLLESLCSTGIRLPLRLAPLLATRPAQISIVNRENCAHAHVVAALALAAGRTSAGGRAFMVTEGASFNVFEYTQQVARACGFSDRLYTCPVELLLAVVWLIDVVVVALYRLGLLAAHFRKVTTASLVLVAYDSVVLDTTLADELGYRPIRTTAEALGEVCIWAKGYTFPPP